MANFKRSSSFRGKRKVSAHLKAILILSEEGYFLYPPGKNDHTVAAAFDCNSADVAALRLEMFGKGSAGRKARLEHRLRTLEKYLDEFNPGWRKHTAREE